VNRALTALVAWVKEAPAQAFDGGVVYPNAFIGVDADIVYAIHFWGSEKNVVLYGDVPVPSDFGLDDSSSVLCVLTELVDLNSFSVERPNSVRPSEASPEPIRIDKAHGQSLYNLQRCFAYSEDENSLTLGGAGRDAGQPVSMRVFTVEGRTFLSEEVPVAPLLKSSGYLFVSKPDLTRTTLRVPPLRPEVLAGRAGAPSPAEMALSGVSALPRLSKNSPRYVIDYINYSGTQTNSVTLLNCLIRDSAEGVGARTNQLVVYNTTFDNLSRWAIGSTGAAKSVYAANCLFASATNGLSGSGMYFDGNDWLDAGDVLDVGPVWTTLTVSAWVKIPSSYASSNIQMWAISKNQEASPYTGWCVTMNNNNAVLLNLISSYPTRADVNSSSLVRDGTWRHVCGVFSAPTNRLSARVFVDGADEGLSEYIGSHTATDTTTPLCIGRRSPSGAAPFTGDMDEIRIYEGELPAEDIALLNSCRGPRKVVQEILLDAPGAFVVTNLLGREKYALWAYRDSNTNAQQDVAEAWGNYTNNPVYATNNVSGINIVLSDHYYVSSTHPSRTNSNLGSDPNAPWETFDHIKSEWSTLPDGATVHLEKGSVWDIDYSGGAYWVITHGGSANGGELTIRGDDYGTGAKPMIRRTGGINNGLIVVKASYITFRDFALDGGDRVTMGVAVGDDITNNISHISILNLSITNLGGSSGHVNGIWLTSFNSNTISDCLIEGNYVADYSAHGLNHYSPGPLSNNVWRNNIVKNTYTGGRLPYANSALQICNGGSGNIFEYNYLEDRTANQGCIQTFCKYADDTGTNTIRHNILANSGAFGILYTYDAERNTPWKILCDIYGNMFYNNAKAGLGIHPYNWYATGTTLNVYNNTFYNNWTNGADWSYSGEVEMRYGCTNTHITFINNILYHRYHGSTVGLVVGDYDNDFNGTLMHSNNLYWHENGSDAMVIKYNLTSDYTVAEVGSFELTAQNSDPLFVNSSQIPTQVSSTNGTSPDGLSLMPTSPAATNGLALTSKYATDIDLNARTVPWSIGAYEYDP